MPLKRIWRRLPTVRTMVQSLLTARWFVCRLVRLPFIWVCWLVALALVMRFACRVLLSVLLLIQSLISVQLLCSSILNLIPGIWIRSYWKRRLSTARRRRGNILRRLFLLHSMVCLTIAIRSWRFQKSTVSLPPGEHLRQR